MRDNRIVIVGIVIVVLIAGAAIVFFGGRTNTGDQNIVSVPEVISVEETEHVNQESTTEDAISATVTVQSEQVVPTPRTDFVATNPGSVNLVSGNVQFVEAFAFW